MVEKGSSDLHITTGSPPQLRIDGELVPLKAAPLSPVETKQICYSVLTDAQKAKFEEDHELDLSFGVKALSRFRANLYMQRGAVAGAIRTIPFKILTFQELGLPPVVTELSKKPRGLVLVTGPTGSGKSTTLASIIDKINTDRHEHIMTIEDPIEYLHPHKNCLINQREVGADTRSFKTALKYILRQDPDVVLVGEMRDLETIEAALVIAETGHVCFGTLHTNSCVQTINRVLDVFPPFQQPQIRAQLSFVIEGVLSADLPWGLIFVGAALAAIAELVFRVPSLPFAVGIYLPLSTNMPVFIGGCVRRFVEKRYFPPSRSREAEESDPAKLLSAGFIAGEGLMGVVIAIIAFALSAKPKGVGVDLGSLVSMLAFAMLIALVWGTARKAAIQRA